MVRMCAVSQHVPRATCAARAAGENARRRRAPVHTGAVGPALVFYDLLFVVLATALYGGALTAGARVFDALSARVPWPFAVFPAAFAGLAVLIAEVSLLSALCPRLRPGRYPMMKGPVFFGWIARSLLRRILFLPGLRFVLFSSNVLRFFALRGLGAKVAFSTNMSVDVDLLDPSLFVAGPRATIGARCLVSGHYIDKGELILGEVRVGAGSLLAAEVICAPGVVVGEGVMVKGRASLSVGARVDDGASIGGEVVIDANAHVGAGARIDTCAHVKPRVRIPPGERVRSP
jgi:hypothetical protein